MRPERRTSSTVAVLVGSLLLLVAATIGPATAAPTTSAVVQPSEYSQTDDADGNLTAETILDSYHQRVDSLETLAVTVESNVSSDSFSSSSEQRVWVDFENSRMRTERNSSYGETITVRNESGTVVYNVDENTVTEYDIAFGEGYGGQFGLNSVLNDSDVTYEGTETINGTETYRLDVDPQSQYIENANATLWLNTETSLPVRFEMATDGQYSYEVSQRYTNVSINETIADDRFTIDIPDDAEQPDHSTPEFYSYENESELRANTTQSVPDPDVPDNYSFDSGYVTEGESYSSVTLNYETESDGSLTVSRSESAGYNYSEHDDFEAVSVGNQTGYYNEFDYGDSNISILVWECGDGQYTVYGSLNESETIAVAESIDCE